MKLRSIKHADSAIGTVELAQAAERAPAKSCHADAPFFASELNVPVRNFETANK